tara:strand:+ start:1679 stop:2641 length:963 start_codon:yes stop_codon:yes gene_type:complete
MTLVVESIVGGLLIGELSALLSTSTIGGIAIKQALPSAINVSWITYKFCRRGTIVYKIAKCLYSYTVRRHPHEKELSPYLKVVAQTLSMYNSKQLHQYYKYLKGMKEIFYSIELNDHYWNKNKMKLLKEPERLRQYILKKLFIKTLFQNTIVKLWAFNPNSTELQKLNDQITYNFINEQIDVDEVECWCLYWEKKLLNQYKTNKKRYDDDFLWEKAQIVELVKESEDDTDNYQVPMLAAINQFSKIINRQENTVADNIQFRPSPQMELSMNIKKGSIAEENRENALFMNSTNLAENMLKKNKFKSFGDNLAQMKLSMEKN